MKRAIGFVGRVLLFVAIAACFAIVIVPPFLDRIDYRGPVSDHFDGQRFANPTVRPGVEVVVSRNHHWGTRWGVDRNRALWSSFVVRLASGNLFFAGDTGFGDGEWPREAATLGPIRLALIPIGAFRFRPGQMGTATHVGPIEAAEVFERSGVTRGLAMHWGTFHLSSEGYDTPPRLLAAVNACRGIAGFDAVAVGRPVEIGPLASRKPAAPLDPRCLDTPQVSALR